MLGHSSRKLALNDSITVYPSACTVWRRPAVRPDGTLSDRAWTRFIVATTSPPRIDRSAGWRDSCDYNYPLQFRREISDHQRRSPCSKPGRAARYGGEASPSHAGGDAPRLDSIGDARPEIESFEPLQAIYALVVRRAAFPYEQRVSASLNSV